MPAVFPAAQSRHAVAPAGQVVPGIGTFTGGVANAAMISFPAEFLHAAAQGAAHDAVEA